MAYFSLPSLLLAFLCILIATSSSLDLSCFNSPWSLLPLYQVSHFTDVTLPRSSSLLCWKEMWDTQIGCPVGGYFLCSGEFAGPAVYHRHLLELYCIIPSGFYRLSLISVVILQKFVLTSFFLPSLSNTYDSSALTTTSKQMALKLYVIGFSLFSEMPIHIHHLFFLTSNAATSPYFPIC